jgi:hypothetical protein
LVLVALWASGAAAQVGTPSSPRSGVTLQVRDANGRGVAAATVTLRDAGRREVQQTTNADGIARFPDVVPGAGEVQVNATDFSPATRQVVVTRGATIAIEIVLNRTVPAPSTPGPLPAQTTPPPEPAPGSGLPRATGGGVQSASSLAPADKVFVPLPDRWNIGLPDWDRYGRGGDYPYVSGHWWDPYNRNRIKGDYPLLGQRTFFVFTGVSDTLVEGRSVPTGAPPSSAQPLGERFFSSGTQYLPVTIVRTSFDLFHGDTAFRPVDWRVRVQPAMSVNYLHLPQTGGVNRDVRRGTTRFDSHLGLQEAFVEKKLADLSVNYDFLSVRAGIQELSTDFRGFIAVVEQPGVRLFGTLRSNRIEYNAAVFDFLEKDTNSAFNELHRRGQQMAVANVYVQDFLSPGYTGEFSVHYNRDAGERHYDANGFLVRPSPIGSVAEREVRAWYLGWAGSGHVGRLNISHALYQAFGTDQFNPIAARALRINAQMAAIEASVDRDWLRFKGALFYASGDETIDDDRGSGFDAIVDIPVFAGGAIGTWNRQGLALAQTGTGLVSPLSLLPSLRTNKDEGQANFVNPGIIIFSGGADAEVTPRLRAFTNVASLHFRHTEPIEALLFQAPIRRSIGLDFGGGAQYRPALSENVVLAGGAAALRLGSGLRAVYDRRWLVQLFATMRLQF